MRKTTEERIAQAQEERQQLDNRIKQLKQTHNAEERKKRTNRLCKRHGYIEKHLPDIIGLTDEQFEKFIGTTLLTTFTRRKLDGIMTQTAESTETTEPILDETSISATEIGETTTSESEGTTL